MHVRTVLVEMEGAGVGRDDCRTGQVDAAGDEERVAEEGREVKEAMEGFREKLDKGLDVAFVIRKGALTDAPKVKYSNGNTMLRLLRLMVFGEMFHRKSIPAGQCPSSRLPSVKVPSSAVSSRLPVSGCGVG